MYSVDKNINNSVTFSSLFYTKMFDHSECTHIAMQKVGCVSMEVWVWVCCTIFVSKDLYVWAKIWSFVSVMPPILFSLFGEHVYHAGWPQQPVYQHILQWTRRLGMRVKYSWTVACRHSGGLLQMGGRGEKIRIHKDKEWTTTNEKCEISMLIY